MSRVAAALVLLALAGCGFQLRGDASAGLRSVHVSAERPSGVAVELRRQLASGSARLAAKPQEADVQLRLLEEATDKTIQTLTGAGRVYDYVLRLRVRFSATAAGGQEVVAPAEFEVRRVVTYSETAPLAKEAEERLLFEDMRAEAAARILRRVAVASSAGSR